MRSGRETILTRIREALGELAPHPGHGHAEEEDASASDVAVDFRPWLPQVGSSRVEWLRVFAKNFDALRGRLLAGNDREKVTASLRKLAEEQGWKRIACLPGGEAEGWAKKLGCQIIPIQRGYHVEDLESCDVGLTECDVIVAQTGSILVTSRTGGGRALSIFPPHHVVIAKVEQIVPDLSAAYGYVEQTYAPNYPSMMSFVTGPSRTGDIERILVLGAHGPKELTLGLVGVEEGEL